MSLLIKNGRIITSVDDYYADIYIDDEKIDVIGKKLEMEADTVLDAEGYLVIPGTTNSKIGMHRKPVIMEAIAPFSLYPL